MAKQTNKAIISNEGGKWVARFKGQVLVQSTRLEYVQLQCEKALSSKVKKAGVSGYLMAEGTVGKVETIGGQSEAHAHYVSPNDKFTISQRFDFMEKFVKTIIHGGENGPRSLLITGSGGLGKSHTVFSVLADAGMTCTVEDMLIDDALPGDGDVQKMIIEKVYETVIAGNEMFDVDLEVPAIDFNLYTKAIGNANSQLNSLSFNMALLRNAENEERENTAVHEVAHLFQRRMHGESVRARGKEWKQIMEDLGYEPSTYHYEDTSIINETNQLEGDYHLVKGFSTTKALYRTLFTYRDKTIVFDDCDNIMKDKDAANILKAALDSGDNAIVSWNVDKARGGLPKNFIFTGKIIFISNLRQDEIPQPILSRALRMDLTMTAEQKIERMRDIMPHLNVESPVKVRQEVLKFMDAHKDVATNLDIRTFLNLIALRTDYPDVWKQLGEYNLVS
jgi:predicted SprT family Zn-dependent metalloprotease